MADDEYTFAIVHQMEQMQKIGERGFWSQSCRFQNFGLKPCFSRNQLRGLHRSLERAGVDRVKTNFHRVEQVRQTKALLFAFLVEGAFQIESRIGAASACAGVAKNV